VGRLLGMTLRSRPSALQHVYVCAFQRDFVPGVEAGLSSDGTTRESKGSGIKAEISPRIKAEIANARAAQGFGAASSPPALVVEAGKRASKTSNKPSTLRSGFDVAKGRDIFTGAPMVPSRTALGARVMALEGKSESLRRLVKTTFAFCDEANGLGNSPMIFACQAGQVECMRELLMQRANVRAPNRSGMTPLHMAASKGHAACTELLLTTIRSQALTKTRMEGLGMEVVEKRVQDDLNRGDRAGSTPLIMASLESHVTICQMLVDANASVNLPSRSYLTPLAAARFRGHEEVAQVLYYSGARDPPSIAELQTWG